MITYTNDADDYIAYYMYMASRSGVVVRRKALTRYLFAILYFLLGFYFLYDGLMILGGVFVLLGILWFVLFPLMNNRSSARFYRKYINENYSGKLGREIQLALKGDHLFVSDGKNQSSISLSEVEKLVETKDRCFLKLKHTSALIIPKKNDITAFKNEIAAAGIPFSDESSS